MNGAGEMELPRSRSFHLLEWVIRMGVATLPSLVESGCLPSTGNMSPQMFLPRYPIYPVAWFVRNSPGSCRQNSLTWLSVDFSGRSMSMNLDKLIGTRSASVFDWPMAADLPTNRDLLSARSTIRKESGGKREDATPSHQTFKGSRCFQGEWKSEPKPFQLSSPEHDVVRQTTRKHCQAHSHMLLSPKD